MVDKIRLHLAGRLPPGYNVGVHDWYHFDSCCTRFLGVEWGEVVRRVKHGAPTSSC